MSRKTLIRLFLAVAAILIWGNNLVLLLSGNIDEGSENRFSENHNAGLTVDSTQSSDELSLYRYQAKSPDPFVHKLKSARSRTAGQSQVSSSGSSTSGKAHTPDRPRPAIRYNGMIRDERGQLVIIETPSGDVVFLKQYEEIEGVRIEQITRDSLLCRFDGKPYWLLMH